MPSLEFRCKAPVQHRFSSLRDSATLCMAALEYQVRLDYTSKLHTFESCVPISCQIFYMSTYSQFVQSREENYKFTG